MRLVEHAVACTIVCKIRREQDVPSGPLPAEIPGHWHTGGHSGVLVWRQAR